MVKGGSRGKESGEFKKGLWTTEEDNLLLEYVKVHGKGKWNRIPNLTGLKRCGKSCRLRWMNYLSPNVKKGDFSQDEDDLIIRLHKLLGNRWSLIAGRVPGRTDNQVKNYWNTHLSKKLGIKQGKCKSIPTLSHPHRSMNNTIDSNAKPSAELSERGPVEGLKCVEVVTHPSISFGEISSKEEDTLMEKHNCQSSLIFSKEDDDLIVNNQSLLDFLSEYSLDYVWNNAL